MKQFAVLAIMIIVFCAMPLVSYSGTVQECELSCVKKCESPGDQNKYDGCLVLCLNICYQKPLSSFDWSSPILDELDEKSKKLVNNVRRKNLKYAPCYAQTAGKKSFYVWCWNMYPWINIKDTRKICYATYEDCFKDGNAQSKECIKCDSEK